MQSRKDLLSTSEAIIQQVANDDTDLNLPNQSKKMLMNPTEVLTQLLLAQEPYAEMIKKCVVQTAECLVKQYGTEYSSSDSGFYQFYSKSPTESDESIHNQDEQQPRELSENATQVIEDSDMKKSIEELPNYVEPHEEFHEEHQEQPDEQPQGQPQEQPQEQPHEQPQDPKDLQQEPDENQNVDM